jgi:FkbM family methyltransferase
VEHLGGGTPVAAHVRNPIIKRLTRKLRGRWRARVLKSHGIAIVAQTKNGLLAVQPGDFNVSRELLSRGEYDWQPIRWLTKLVNADSRLVFAGAHIGAVLVPIAAASGTSAILAFEPSPRNYRLLTMNLRLNQLDGVVARNVALGQRPGRLQFTENSINTGNSRIAETTGEILVEVETLDRCVPPEWQVIDLMVMDIEGSEVAAMRGAAAALAKTRYLYAEFAPWQLREQGSSSAEFLEVVSRFFTSAYVFGTPISFLGPGQFAGYLESRQDRDGFLVNLLFSHDSHADSNLMQVDAGR